MAETFLAGNLDPDADAALLAELQPGANFVEAPQTKALKLLAARGVPPTQENVSRAMALANVTSLVPEQQTPEQVLSLGDEFPDAVPVPQQKPPNVSVREDALPPLEGTPDASLLGADPALTTAQGVVNGDLGIDPFNVAALMAGGGTGALLMRQIMKNGGMTDAQRARAASTRGTGTQDAAPRGRVRAGTGNQPEVSTAPNTGQRGNGVDTAPGAKKGAALRKAMRERTNARNRSAKVQSGTPDFRGASVANTGNAGDPLAIPTALSRTVVTDAGERISVVPKQLSDGTVVRVADDGRVFAGNSDFDITSEDIVQRELSRLIGSDSEAGQLERSRNRARTGRAAR